MYHATVNGLNVNLMIENVTQMKWNHDVCEKVYI